MKTKPTWMSERNWKLANAKNEREEDRLIREFFKEDAKNNHREPLEVVLDY